MLKRLSFLLLILKSFNLSTTKECLNLIIFKSFMKLWEITNTPIFFKKHLQTWHFIPHELYIWTWANKNLAVFFFYGYGHLHNKHKNNHLAPWLLWVPGIKNRKYNWSVPLAFKSQRVGYQSNQKLLHHYQHSKYQLNS